MRPSAVFFCLTALLGFWLFHGTARFKPPISSPLIRHLPGLPVFKNDPSAIWIAMVTGQDKELSKPTKKAYFRLGLGHLFTPSGIHLAALGPVLRRLTHGFYLYWFLGVFSMIVPGLLAMGRVAWLKCFPNLKQQLAGFCIILLIEGLLYSWKEAPLSWTCSWLFLGLTYFAPKRSLFAWYLLAQMLLTWVFHQQFSLFSLPANLIFGIPLALLFPLILLFSFIPWSFLHQGLYLILSFLHDTVMSLDSLHGTVPAFTLHSGHLILGLLFLCVPGRSKTKAIASMLLLLSAPAGSWQRESAHTSKWEIVPAPQSRVLQTFQGKTGLRSIWSDGTSCNHQLVQGIWREGCRARGPGRGIARTKKLSSKR